MRRYITAERLAAVYEMLREFPPFCQWKLPVVGEVGFHVAKTDRHFAAWWMDNGTHHIEVSEKRHGHMDSLLASMAHEMLHMHQRISKTETTNTEHNAEFHRIGTLIAKRYGWDAAMFV